MHLARAEPLQWIQVWVQRCCKPHRYTEEEIEVETSALRKQLEAEGVQTRQDKYAAAATPLHLMRDHVSHLIGR